MVENGENVEGKAPTPEEETGVQTEVENVKETGAQAEVEKEDREPKGLKNKSWLQAGAIGFLAALLTCVLLGGSFAIGYAVGNGGDHGKPYNDRGIVQDMGRAQQMPGAIGQRLEGVQENLGVDMIRGKVTSVSTEKITVNSPRGDQTIRITSATVNNTGKEIAEGDQVVVLVKETEGQEPEAISIAVLENVNASQGNKSDRQGQGQGPGNIQQQGQNNI